VVSLIAGDRRKLALAFLENHPGKRWHRPGPSGKTILENAGTDPAENAGTDPATRRDPAGGKTILENAGTDPAAAPTRRAGTDPARPGGS
jgi:hypothetical protein